jgi:hypothetical protein
MLKIRLSPRIAVRFTALFAVVAAFLLIFTAGHTSAAKRRANERGDGVKNAVKGPVKIAENGETASGIIHGRSYHNDTSPPLREMRQLPMQDARDEDSREMNENPKLPVDHKDAADLTVQSWLFPEAMPTPALNFAGIGFPGVSCNCHPPDTNGEVGATQYVQMVNEGYQVFNKTTGASVLGPSSIVSLWAGFGGVCQANGAGDPVVMYDQIANRWIVTQFAGSGIPTDQCIAVSTSSDATGSYNRYGFHLGTNFFDYPHLGVWPDGYYMSMNVFNSAGSAFLGPQAFAFDRTAMLNGTAATFVSPGITGGANEDSFLPADLDGLILPAGGTACPFVEFPGSGGYKTFLFRPNFATPANTTFLLLGSPAAAGFSALCATTRACVPQLAPQAALDGIGDRLMYRLAYRKFADGHEAVVGNYSVSSGGVAGIRWFELRGVTTAPTVFQENTYQPDTDWRWMGSVAQDTNGNMALGFSASSAAISPQIRYAGRLAGDPPNTLAQGEAHLVDGTGSQGSGNGNRWGDYSDMTVDPVDDCTFWYTQEYLIANGGAWQTRIGSFKFPSCSLTPTFGLAVTPRSQAICAGTNATYTITTSSINGFTDPILLTVTGNPAGTIATFSPATVSPGGSSTLTISNTGSGARGPYTMNVMGDTGAITRNENAGIYVFVGTPGEPSLGVPSNGATGQPISPTFNWSSGPDVQSFTLDIATDAGFTNIVHTASGIPFRFNPQSYTGGSLNAGVTYFWRVRAVTPCGTSASSQVFVFTTAPGICNEAFDSVMAPALPTGWTATNAAGDPVWKTTTTTPDTAPNALFVDDQDGISDKYVDSPGIPINSASAQISFRNSFNTEMSGGIFWDGGVLEISSPNINGGAFTDVTAPAVGGSFVSGGYTGPIDTTASNPLAGRMAWSGNSGGYINTVVNLGPNVNGRTIRLRFRMGSDEAVSAPGWWVDTLAISGGCMSSAPSINGTVTYGNAIGAPTPPRFVSNVLVSAAGSTPISTITGSGGAYTLTGFGSGSYMVTPTKTGSTNASITSFDAARIAQHVAGVNFLTGNQLIVADVSGNGTISSFDAGEVARYVAAVTGTGSTGNWIFNPVNKSYASVTSTVSGEDYLALLMGEVSGNWTDTGARTVESGKWKVESVRSGPQRDAAVGLPQIESAAGKEIIVPVTVHGAAQKGVISYEFDLRYDPSVIQPLVEAADVNGTASRSLSVVTNSTEPGLLRVVVYGATPINDNGVLLNLRFTAIGAPGSVSPISFERIMFNEGDPRVSTSDGQIKLF